MGIDIAGSEGLTEREDLGTEVHLRDIAGELAYETERPVIVRIAGSYSKRYRRIEAAQTQRLFKRRQAGITPEEWQENRLELVAGCVISWDGILNRGVAWPCNKENAIHLVRTCPWIFAQLSTAQDDHASFSGGSSGS